MYVSGKQSLNKGKYNITVNSQYTYQHRISKQNNCAIEEKNEHKITNSVMDSCMEFKIHG
jgi:hypothetical protein